MSYHPVPEARNLPPGKGISVSVAGKRVALFNLEGTIHAIDDTCPHVGAPLGGGWLDGHTVACPMHGWEFDIRTGKGVTVPGCQVAAYPVRVNDGAIEISID
jgi:nitrite reductase/ring-hydroxylating ferredoxin subunit